MIILPAAKKAATTKKSSTAKSKASSTTKKETAAQPKITRKKQCGYIFFNCDEGKNLNSMNIRYNNTIFGDTIAGRKALWDKVKAEASENKINILDAKMVRADILEGEPTDATAKIQYGSIERLAYIS